MRTYENEFYNLESLEPLYIAYDDETEMYFVESFDKVFHRFLSCSYAKIFELSESHILVEINAYNCSNNFIEYQYFWLFENHKIIDFMSYQFPRTNDESYRNWCRFLAKNNLLPKRS